MSTTLGVEFYARCATAPRGALPVTSQLRRAALSIAANIAGGCAKSSRAETIRYLDIANGSAAETEHHLEVARALAMIDRAVCDGLLARVQSIRRMLRSLIRRLPK